MNLQDVELMVCPAGTPVLMIPEGGWDDPEPGPRILWHPGSKTRCEHGEPMQFPSQPAVSPLHLLRQRLRELAVRWEGHEIDGGAYGQAAQELREAIR
jgi:hypothetical protein